MRPSDGDWGEYRMLVIDRLDRIEKKIDAHMTATDTDIKGHDDRLKKLENDMSLIKFKVAAVSAGLGSMSALVVKWLEGLMRG